MKMLILTLLISMNCFASYYTIGDTLDYEIHNPPLNICAGDELGSTIFLSDYIGKIIILGITASWWDACYWMDLEDLHEYYIDDHRVVVIENLDDIGQPYSCEQWAIGAENNQLFTDDGDGYPLFEMFSIYNYFAERAVIDHNKVFRYLGVDNDEVISAVDSILNSWVLGDTNFDQTIDVLDIIIVVNNILNSIYSATSDMNEDGLTNIQDIIILINTILEN